MVVSVRKVQRFWLFLVFSQPVVLLVVLPVVLRLVWLVLLRVRRLRHRLPRVLGWISFRTTILNEEESD